MADRKRRKNLSPREREEITQFIYNSPQLSNKELADSINKMLGKGRTLSITYLTKKVIPRVRREVDSKGAPWCIGSKEVVVPPEVLPVVLSIQTRQTDEARARALSLREVEWIVRLSGLIGDSSTLESWAWAYANREWASELLGPGHTLDTSDFDRVMIAQPWELATGYLTGEIEPVTRGIFRPERVGGRIVPTDAPPEGRPSLFRYPITPLTMEPVFVKRDLIALSGWARVAEVAFVLGMSCEKAKLVATGLYRALDSVESGEDWEKYFEVWDSIPDMPMVGQLPFSQEQFRVYTFWLRAMNSSESPEDMEAFVSRIEIVRELREWVMNHELAQDSRCLLPTVTNPDLIEPLVRRYNLAPLSILEKLGIALEYTETIGRRTDGG